MTRSTLLTGAAGAAALFVLAGCTVHKTEAPPLTGPSELGTAITVQVTPDVLTQDGASQSLVTITARNANGQPIPNLSLRADIMVNGSIADFGTLSAHNVVTDSTGRAQVTFTAPPAPAVSVDTGTVVSIAVTPAGTNFANALARTANIRLVPPGVITPPSNGVTPKFTFTPPAPTDHQPVIFDASASTSTNATIVSYQWNFGDGNTASGVSVQHSYTTGGTFVVTLTIADNLGRSNSTSQTITVSTVTLGSPNITTSPASPLVGQTVFFTSTTTVGSNGRPIVSYDWNFGDGTSGSGQSTTHVYSTAGIYTVILTAKDDQGHTASATTTLTVGNGNPTADFTFNPTSPSVGQAVAFDASPSQAAPGRTIVTYFWSFDDGTSGTGKTVTHAYGAPATYNVRLTVTDDQGKTGSTTKAVTVK